LKPLNDEERTKQSEVIDSEISKLNRQIANCQLCRLCQGRTKAVPGSGRIFDLEVMFVGEAPGRNEDLQGEPFVGAGGKLLDSILGLARLSRENVFITNVVKCRPPMNRKPFNDEIEICTTNYLEVQIDYLKPRLICTLGATALEYFTGEKKMGPSRGKLTSTKKGVPLLPTYHPASIFRNASHRALLEEDVKKIPSILKELKENSKTREGDIRNFSAFSL
jgi:uracil-DNA glycosylase family 4